MACQIETVFFSLQSVYLLFPFLAILHWLELPILTTLSQCGETLIFTFFVLTTLFDGL